MFRNITGMYCKLSIENVLNIQTRVISSTVDECYFDNIPVRFVDDFEYLNVTLAIW